ncbi:MAG: hypothetical protein IPM77_14320 [Crocinitomicaceae bacterium]|nr:hypothetical protein [Crocinitomicaceae bacterium]
MIFRISHIVLVFCFFQVTYLFADSDWVPAKDEDGIKVYTRQVDGWDVHEFKVICVMNVKRYIIYETLIDVVKYPQWYPDIVESELCKKISETEFYCYSKMDIPWPSDDRDGECHIKVTHNKEEKVTLINMTVVEKYKSKADGYVRMTRGKGFWKLTSKGEGCVVHYQYLSDPGGSMPSWLINMFIVDNPYNTVKALRDRVGG